METSEEEILYEPYEPGLLAHLFEAGLTIVHDVDTPVAQAERVVYLLVVIGDRVSDDRFRAILEVLRDRIDRLERRSAG